MRSIFLKISGIFLAFVALAASSQIISAQSAGANNARITQAVSENDRVMLRGNTHPLASAKNDQGAAPDGLPLARMLMVLRRSPEQESSLKALMESQQTKTSPNFHQWLTPEQFGQQFGASDSDIQIVTAWLEAHGFQVNRVAASRTLIEFSGTAGQVKAAFQTQIHKYLVNGEEHWANAGDPTIPAALAPVIMGINTLHNFGKKPMIHNHGVISRPAAVAANSGAVSPLDNTGCPLGFASGLASSATCFGVGPADFAAIYNVPATIGGAPGGTGQTIAIVGDSQISLTDVTNFRTLFGLPTGGASNTPKIVLDGPDPGFNGDEIEGDLDVEYSAAVAPNAQILFVIAADTASSSGVDLAAEHVIDYNLAPVMSESFGECEFFLGNAGNAFYASLWEQAAAQGITVIISSGDSASAGCDPAGARVAQNGLNVNGLASTPFNVAAGGTDFDYQAAGYPGSFWNATNGAGGLSAKGYVPETPWNDSCAQSPAGQTTGCNAFILNSTSPVLQVSGGGGGQSNCAIQNVFGCTSSYAKPTWQTGSSVPNDLVRDIPDVSLFSSGGQISGSFYIVCAADLGGTCATGGPNVTFLAVGGTSAAAPTFAGIMALVNQNMVFTGHSGSQGNANFVLYPMSAGQIEANCNSSLIPAANCVFNDVTKGNNSAPCIATSLDCSNTTPNSNVVGVLVTRNDPPFPNGGVGFNSSVGYDPATGLGSLNVTNLVNGWPAAVGSFTPTTASLTLTPTVACPPGTPGGIASCVTVTHGTQVNVGITVTGGAGISGDVSLIGTCQTLTPNCFVGNSNTAGVDRFDPFGNNVNVYPLTNGTISGAFTKELVGGRYNVTAHYAGDGIHGASDSTSPIQVIVNPEGSTAALAVFGNLTTASSATYGSLVTLRTDVLGAASGFETATGQVTLNDTFAGSVPVILSLNSEGHVELQAPTISFPGNNNPVTTIPALAVGAHSFTAVYAGDASYNPSTSVSVPLTISKAPTVSTITTSPGNVLANTNFTLVASLASASFGVAPTGNVTFLAGATVLGTVPVVGTAGGNFPASAVATLTTAQITATSSITAQFVGDTNYATSTSAPVTVSLTTVGTFALSSTAVTIATPGQSGTSTITANGSGGFAAGVALTCSVTATAVLHPPTCSVTSPINLTVATTSGTATLTVFTTAASSVPFRPTDYFRIPRWLVETSAASGVLALLLLLTLPPVRKRRSAVVLASLFIMFGLAVAGCGSSGAGGGGNPGTPAGNYTVTVTGTGGTVVANTTVNVTVQ